MEITCDTLMECKQAYKLQRHAPLTITRANVGELSVIHDLSKDLNKAAFEPVLLASLECKKRICFENNKIDPLISVAKPEAVVDAYQRSWSSICWQDQKWKEIEMETSPSNAVD